MAIPETPLTRLEQYLNRIATGNGVIPNVPLTRIEQYLNRIATKDGAIPETPLTRTEQYLNKIATGEGIIPNVPLTRSEQYLAKIAGQDTAVPEVPLSRVEQYLAEISENGGGGAVLPPEYQQVEWIAKTNGNPYINTGILPTKTQKYLIGIKDADGNTIYSSGNSNSLRVQLWVFNQNFFFRYFGENGNAVSAPVMYVSNELNELAIDYNNHEVVKDGITYRLTGTYAEEEIIYPMTLFAQNIAGTITSFSSTKIYYFAIHENANPILNLVPCYRKSDGVIGMYDTVTETFFTNAGTGAFTKGADVT